MAKLNEFVDLQHAVGMIWCLEDHMSKIYKVLDMVGVPAGMGERRFTVLQRVQILAGATEYKKISKAQMERAASIVAQLPDELNTDPEDIIDAIGTETFEERMKREGVIKDGADDSGDQLGNESGSNAELGECDSTNAGLVRESAV